MLHSQSRVCIGAHPGGGGVDGCFLRVRSLPVVQLLPLPDASSSPGKACLVLWVSLSSSRHVRPTRPVLGWPRPLPVLLALDSACTHWAAGVHALPESRDPLTAVLSVREALDGESERQNPAANWLGGLGQADRPLWASVSGGDEGPGSWTICSESEDRVCKL